MAGMARTADGRDNKDGDQQERGKVDGGDGEDGDLQGWGTDRRRG